MLDHDAVLTLIRGLELGAPCKIAVSSAELLYGLNIERDAGCEVLAHPARDGEIHGVAVSIDHAGRIGG